MEASKTDKPKDKSLWSILVSGLSIFIALYSLWLSWNAGQQNEHISRVNAYLQMRDDFYKVEAAIPEQYYRSGFIAVPAVESSDRRAIENYWYFTFDEWYTSTHLDPDDSQALWNNYYSHFIEPMMEKPVPRKVLCALITNEFNKSRVQTEFANTLETIYAKDGGHHGTKLCS